MLAVGHDCPKVNLQFENKVGPQKVLEEVQKVLSKVSTSSAAMTKLSTSDQRKIAFQASYCSGLIAVAGWLFRGYCWCWLTVQGLLLLLVDCSGVIAVAGWLFRGYCCCWLTVQGLLLLLVDCSGVIAVAGWLFRGYCCCWLMLGAGAAWASYSLLPWDVDVKWWCSPGKLCFNYYHRHRNLMLDGGAAHASYPLLP